MRRLVFVPLLLFVVGTVHAQTDSLTLKTKITDAKYCGGDYADMAMLRMSLQLTFTNNGSGPLILYKGSTLIHYLLVAEDTQRILNKQYELNMHVGWVTSGGTLREGDGPDNKFVILKPGETFQGESAVNVPIALQAESQFLKSGQHVMQGVVETWPTDEEQLNRLRKKWERVGYLWGANVRSEPMRFAVAAKPRLVECK